MADKLTQATAAKLLRLLPICPACNITAHGHLFALTATAIIGEDEKARITELISRVRKHDWAALHSFKEWKATCDNAVVYAIKGPHPEGVVILIRSPYELYERDEIFVQEIVNSEDLAAISELVLSSDWQPL
jgi:hypothetical protein